MTDNLYHVKTLIEEGQAFVQRNNIPPVAADLAALTWGFMRAIAECPNCPGKFRVPLDENWDWLYCPHCGGYWEHRP